MAANIYTDLAAEARELDPDLAGVTEQTERRGGITISRIEITGEEAAKKLGKPLGKYVTMDAPELADRPLELFEKVSRELAEEIRTLMPQLPLDAPVLVVGLGNRYITPDALGPRVVEQVFVTRHLLEYMPELMDFTPRSVAAVAPGVLGITGVETLEIVRGVVERVQPKLVIAVDSLASRRAARISTTIQLTDSGIDPGSGVGNERRGLNQNTLGVPVIAIGVPMVVYASTISQDTISMIAEETGLHNDEEKLRTLAEKVLSERFGPMIVTPKDVDSIVRDMSRVLADGINFAMQGIHYEDVREIVV
ncbi:MAG: GPR endopeptidase [Clostridia bacterium]|nr:GPR endopeptidase [Clostridia bacterium]